ncbi:SDR family oxidoreductase [Streptomyces sp. URMC 123]|uniref:SDR family oxidoreductase n=1 Tax=Streptomyces sp. URMC 123 TaxID=3423403 RepID=UPI003F1BAC41
MTTHLVTGATGFVGGAITLELLARTDHTVLALVRGRSPADARRRVREALASMAVGYGRADLLGAIGERVEAVPGDISRPGCGVDAAALPAVDEVWHSAASLRYEEEHRAEIEALNIGGTEQVLRLARAAGAASFTYISTAYVAGARAGTVLEEPVHDPALANNCYEESKIRAEALVTAAAGDFRVRVMRPTIVVGHRVTRHGVNWSGLYGFARQVLSFHRAAQQKVGTFLSHARVRLVADPTVRANLVPVDVVARNAVTIALSDSSETYFHLANSGCPTIKDVITVIMSLTGLREPLWVPDKDGFTMLDETLDKGMDFYRSYLRNDKTFDLSHTRAVCGEDSSYAPMDRDEITAYVLRYLRGRSGFTEGAGPVRTLHPVVL